MGDVNVGYIFIEIYLGYMVWYDDVVVGVIEIGLMWMEIFVFVEFGELWENVILLMVILMIYCDFEEVDGN